MFLIRWVFLRVIVCVCVCVGGVFLCVYSALLSTLHQILQISMEIASTYSDEMCVCGSLELPYKVYLCVCVSFPFASNG